MLRLIRGLCAALSYLLVSMVVIISAAAQEPVSSAVISPSPEVSAIANFAETPVDLHSGLASINVPLYTIQSRKLSYPLALNYHSGGIKLNEGAAWTGLGFALSGPSVITRVMRGLPDEGEGGYFTYASSVPNSTDNIDMNLKTSLANGDVDMLPDLFYFSINSGTGKMLFDNQLQPRLVSKEDYKITVNNTTTLDFFKITADDGTSYEFNLNERTHVSLKGPDVTYLSTWYLTRIVSADRTDTIKFNYTTVGASSYTTNQGAVVKYFYNVPAGARYANNTIVNQANTSTVTVVDAKQLASIEYASGKVVFQTGAREDITSAKKLDALLIYDKDPITGAMVLEKKINLLYGYWIRTIAQDQTLKLLRLENVQEVSPSGLKNPQTHFTYNSKIFPIGLTFAQDHWGYYNGANENTGLMAAMAYGGPPPKTVYTLSANNREPDGTKVDAFMLRKISNGMGGETEYQFENNLYGSNKIGPGMRIARIIKRDTFSNIRDTTSYEYLVPGTSNTSGILLNNPSYYTQLMVEDYEGTGDMEYNCLYGVASPNDIGNFSDADLVYTYVTEYKGNKKTTAGKSVYTYNVNYTIGNGYPYLPINDDNLLAGNLNQEQHYNVSGTTETLVKQIDNTYASSSAVTTIKGLKAAYNKIIFNRSPTASELGAFNYYGYSRFNYQSKVTTSDYELGGGAQPLQTTTNYFYIKANSNTHVQLTKDSTVTSDPNTFIKHEYLYARDYAATGVMGTMQNLNMVNTPVEVKTIIKQGSTEKLINYSKSDYFEFLPNQVYVQNIYTPKFGSPVVRATFDASPSTYYKLNMKLNQYTKEGFLVETEHVGDIPLATLVDKIQNRPVAEITAARFNQVAYSSFESVDFGQWDVTAGTQAKTGTLTLNQSGGFTTFEITAGQTLTYNYTVTRSAGASPILTFSKTGTTPIDNSLVLSSGSGSVTLTAGVWNASLYYETNVTAASVTFSYNYTYKNPINIIGTDNKTGTHALSFTSTHIVSKTSLPAGDYVISYFQKNGTPTFTLAGGATLTNSTTGTTGTDGWTLVTKLVHITGTGNTIQFTGTGMMIDELRLYPVNALMTTSCYDVFHQLTSTTDANLQSKYFEYDDWGRVKAIRDNNRNILQYSEYKLTGN